jgi:hypothetical protein
LPTSDHVEHETKMDVAHARYWPHRVCTQWLNASTDISSQPTEGKSTVVVERYSSGRKPVDLAAIILDTGVPSGEGLVEVDGLRQPVGAGSTIVATAIGLALVASCGERLAAEGYPLVQSVRAAANEHVAHAFATKASSDHCTDQTESASESRACNLHNDVSSLRKYTPASRTASPSIGWYTSSGGERRAYAAGHWSASRQWSSKRPHQCGRLPASSSITSVSGAAWSRAWSPGHSAGCRRHSGPESARPSAYGGSEPGDWLRGAPCPQKAWLAGQAEEAVSSCATLANLMRLA